MWGELGELHSAATTRPANVNKLPKMVSFLAKIAFMSKVLESRSNDLQRFRKYKEGQKIPHEISIKLLYDSVVFTHPTSLLLDMVIGIKYYYFLPPAISRGTSIIFVKMVKSKNDFWFLLSNNQNWTKIVGRVLNVQFLFTKDKMKTHTLIYYNCYYLSLNDDNFQDSNFRSHIKS